MIRWLRSLTRSDWIDVACDTTATGVRVLLLALALSGGAVDAGPQ